MAWYSIVSVFVFVVVGSKETECTTITHLCVARGTRVVVSSKVSEQHWRLIQYHLGTGELLSSAQLSEMPWGVEAVKLSGRPCLAVSFM